MVRKLYSTRANHDADKETTASIRLHANLVGTNVGADKDSDNDSGHAIEGLRQAHGYELVGWYYDNAVRGCRPGNRSPGFRRHAGGHRRRGGRTILTESPDRFARDLAVQLAGHDHLKRLGVTLGPASAPDHFTEDTPTAILVRQVLGATPCSTRRRSSPS